MDTYADDLGQLIDTLDLNEAILVGHSTGGGEVTRYIGRHGTSRVTKAVALLSSKLVKGSTLKIYPGTPHGLVGTFKDAFNADLLTFIRA